jgi:hypothetical protein
VLKLNYSELGLFLEQVNVSLDNWLAQWVQLSVRTGQSVYLEPSRAAFLIPADLAALDQLRVMLAQGPEAQGPEAQGPEAQGPEAQGPEDSVEIIPVDADTVEVNLQGFWIAQTIEADEGMFVVVLSDRLETLITHLWQAAPYYAPQQLVA